ncbi:Stk1 family PASTA domain-containing Ser/Thr kinase [uncultured Jatrophihabitans sp.]|uniref:Stk1 family PASTA domain-containing Ser/Thr kinase n=1 Tax=uncultured Jatrophihabitans sp. TaxID=1610747 RepID=UPI0035C9B137
MTQPRMVGDRYELGELIGYGGMAEVHRGLDTRLNREVAIKVLRADLARDPSFLNRFRREAHSAAGLNHPAIVSVYDTGEDAAPDGTSIPFIVMEHVEGRTLRDVLKSEGALPPRRAMEIAADIDAALDFSHRNGIIHRDIKPANVMITQAGAVKVMDFGIARAVADTSATVTQTANVIGTAQYLSPEQARGETVDARSDVYSTGCLLYELITGVPPFQGDSPVAVAYQHVRENPVAPSARNPDIPRALDSIVMKALAKNQLNRYQSAGDMRADLQRALANQPVVAEAVMTDAERTQFIARTPPPPVRPRPMPIDDGDDDSHRRGWIWAAVVLALLLVIGIGTFVIFGSSGGNEVKKVQVADVTGYLPGAAVSKLRAQGLVPTQAATTSGGPCTNNQTVEAGKVCKTTPAVNEEVKKGSAVTYTLYSPKLVNVPFVEQMKYADAVAALAAKGLRSMKKDVYSADPKGTVEKQDTEQFTAVPPGTTIVLEVSTGTIALPNVKGMTLNDATSTIPSEFTKRKTQTRTTPDETKDGTVASQSPKPGYYSPDQQITLTIYKYVKPTPTCTTPPPTPTETPTTQPPGVPVSPSSSGASSSSALPAC